MFLCGEYLLHCGIHTSESHLFHKELVGRTRYIWLKNPWNFTDKQKARLHILEKLSVKIF